ncbi:MAG: phosphatase PAP2 family protein [Pseudobdellovibrionaceae bacterium]
MSPVLEKASDSTSMYLWGAGAATVLMVQSRDADIEKNWGHHQLMPSWQSNIGDRYISYGGNILIALSQLWLDPENGVNHMRALLYTAGLTQTIKLTVHQQRPDDSDSYAFPSGHTSSAFASATSLSYAYGLRAGIPAFAMATMTGLSRISDDKHWASDVVAGALLGIIWGRATYYEPQKTENYNKKNNKLLTEMIPAYERGTLSVNFVHDF